VPSPRALPRFLPPELAILVGEHRPRSRRGAMSEQSQTAVSAIEIGIESISQLFQSLDPSPFNEKDLDKDAEEFVPWARPAKKTSLLQQDWR
jgi:hypothetical protein